MIAPVITTILNDWWLATKTPMILPPAPVIADSPSLDRLNELVKNDGTVEPSVRPLLPVGVGDGVVVGVAVGVGVGVRVGVTVGVGVGVRVGVAVGVGVGVGVGLMLDAVSVTQVMV